METWTAPAVPKLGDLPDMQLFDSVTGQIKPVTETQPRLYTCGITPYDATHLGHAFTYVAADTLVRYWLAGGKTPRYAQNITDIDDPLFERAAATGVDWRALADSQIALFRGDMHALEVQAPDQWVAVSEILDELEAEVRGLEQHAATYRLADPENPGAEDIYIDLSTDSQFAQAPVFRGLDLVTEFDEHGGDSQRPGKRHPLDPMLWKGVRGDDYRPVGGKPGAWRPGWHIECAVIVRDHLGSAITVQAGGKDLLFPHHEMSESHLRELTGGQSHIDFHFHVGMVGYQGEKMSKSLGNLVKVSELTASGVDPRAIRLVLLNHHYRTDWEYTPAQLTQAEARLHSWQAATIGTPASNDSDAGAEAGVGTECGAGSLSDAGSVSSAASVPGAISVSAAASRPDAVAGTVSASETAVERAVIAALSQDLDTPRALARVDQHVAAGGRIGPRLQEVIAALLGIRLS